MDAVAEFDLNVGGAEKAAGGDGSKAKASSPLFT